MRKSYKYKLQNQSNTIKLGNMLDDMWSIHVHIMRLQRRYYRMFGKNVSASRLNAHVTKLKKRTKPHWKELPSQVVQDVVGRYGKSQDAFFGNIKDRKAGKTTRKVGRPKIKPRHKYNSMTFTQAGYTLTDNRIKINCIGTWFSFHKHRDTKGVSKQSQSNVINAATIGYAFRVRMLTIPNRNPRRVRAQGLIMETRHSSQATKVIRYNLRSFSNNH